MSCEEHSIGSVILSKWPDYSGMIVISKKEAIKRFKANKEVFGVDDNLIEALIQDLSDFDDFDIFGYELEQDK